MRPQSLTLSLLLVLSVCIASGCTTRARGGGGGGGDDTIDEGGNDVDTDGDGLTDEEEDALGTDANNVDTDGDGYSDGDEAENDADPTDAEDGIFEGGFPYNPNIDDCTATSFSGSASVGSQLPCVDFETQFDEGYNLWNLRDSAQYLVIDNSAVWCGPCNMMAGWLDGANNDFISEAGNPLREAVWEGHIRWITALYEDAGGSPADSDDVWNWYSEYPTENVLVVGDGGQDMIGWIAPPGIPSLSLVDLETMELLIVDDTNGVLNTLLSSI